MYRTPPTCKAVPHPLESSLGALYLLISQESPRLYPHTLEDSALICHLLYDALPDHPFTIATQHQPYPLCHPSQLYFSSLALTII